MKATLPTLLEETSRESPAFADRREAGARLAAELRRRLAAARTAGRVVVLGVPRGGVAVAAEVAADLGAELDAFMEETVAGASLLPPVDGSVATQTAWRRNVTAELRDSARRGRSLRGPKPPPDVRGCTVILVFDAIGHHAPLWRMLASLRYEGASQIVVAAPVVSRQARRVAECLADASVFLVTSAGMTNAAPFFASFPVVTSTAVRGLLQAHEAQEAREAHAGRPMVRQEAIPQTVAPLD